MKKRIFPVLIFFTVIILAATSCKVQNVTVATARPLNIILFIGDGMGPAQLSAGIAVSDQTLVVESFPYSGFAKTSSSDNYVTDSAASGTAMASGVKTRNGMIGMGPDTTVVTSIMEIAHRNGLATGLVSTSAVTHATPASFVAHNSGRGNYEDIAKDFLRGTIDVFIGGGSKHFNSRADNVDLTKNLATMGYDVVYTMDNLKMSNSSKIAGLIAEEHMGRADVDRIGMLEAMTDKAIEILSRNPRGFILMVEGSQIDFAGHDNNLRWTLAEVLDFDKAVGTALNFAKKDNKTLVVVTADHETGGLILPGYTTNSRDSFAHFGSLAHTAVMVPIFSYGPGAERFSGIHENTFFFNEFLSLLKMKK